MNKIAFKQGVYLYFLDKHLHIKYYYGDIYKVSGVSGTFIEIDNNKRRGVVSLEEYEMKNGRFWSEKLNTDAAIKMFLKQEKDKIEKCTEKLISCRKRHGEIVFQNITLKESNNE